MLAVAFDPGRMTGWYVGDVQKNKIKTLDYGEESLSEELYKTLADCIKKYDIKLLLMEGVVPYGRLNADKIDQVMAYTHVVVLANMLKLPLIIISPEERKRTKFLHRSGVMSKYGHARDASKLVHVWAQQDSRL